MSNKITIELCTEDRERFDGLGVLLANLTDTLAKYLAQPTASTAEDQALQQQLAAAVEKAKKPKPTEGPKNATGEAEASTLPTAHADEEKGTAETDAAPWEPVENFNQHDKQPTPEKAKPSVTLEQIQQKVVQLAAGNGGAKKAKVREIINAYGAKVSDLKDQPDKWAEVWDKLTALESEG